ncbi:MAG TPA: hypothetical protein VJN70_14725 [Gemmatimonadaceae bacterium]|nr:hypothetical protein [Gemmatimonadaceae bacterium]
MTDEETPKKEKEERAFIEPVVKDHSLFEFLELLFYDEPEPANFPERIEVNTVNGRQKEKLTSIVMSLPFAPILTSGDATKRGIPQGKPSREKLVVYSNRILHAMQRDCDESRQRQCYGVHAWHHGRGDDPYMRYLKYCEPKGRYPKEDQNSDEDEPIEKRHSLQMMGHHEKLFSLYGGAFEGILDRIDRVLERQDARIERQDARIEKQAEMLERALSLEAERHEKLEWSKLKAKGVEKALEFGIAMAPPLINQLVGKPVLPTNDTPETITLKNFFRTVDQGGSMTKEQAVQAFGEFDDTTHVLVRPGVLSQEQSTVLFDVATGNQPPDALDKLMPGSGPLGITQEQALALQQVFSLEQIAPLMLIFEARRNRGK